ncbi:hypothetical protein HPB50_000005 [Hyalomma asiaticum]|uniref:Uncharacterized protein n=1 Tax=Hyalomma asiaticum TaxID=266040 RepID=A0ACB7S2V9_HYAAI|nr:hypothetical protein HPB50_000005 [Hyalomma asiaticum]
MEIEEKLYDRFSVCLSDIQLLFTDSGDEWRVARLLPDSDMHLLPKVKVQALFSNSVKPEYRFLPRRLALLMEFARHFPLPHLLMDDNEHWDEVVCFRVSPVGC